jgi:oligo-alginate lyase
MAEPIRDNPKCQDIVVSTPTPSIAATPEELARLKDAFSGTGPAHDAVMERIGRADAILLRPIMFPPEGGQHNQWYQCEQCQIGLTTVDSTHHRCPKCRAVFRGYPFDNVLFKNKHGSLAHEMNTCAWAYAVTGKESYAQAARTCLLGYAERYLKYPYHSANMGKREDEPRHSGGHVMEQTLSEASWALPVCEAYDLVRRSAVFTQADHQKMRDGLWLPLYRNIEKYQAGKSNWQTYHNAAMFCIGAVLGDGSMLKKALEDPENGFYRQMDISVLPGGMWYENSWGYHFYPLEAVRVTAETARRLGIDVYWIPQLKEMYTVALDYQMIDGTLPRFADATTMKIPGGRYETAYHQWRDPLFLTVLPDTPTWESVLYGRDIRPGQKPDLASQKSVLKPGAGHAILRMNGPRGASSAVLTYGPFGGGHGHFDKLSFVYYALGQEQAVDPGRAASQAYRMPIHKNWYRATTGHNTVGVDRQSQEGVTGELEVFVDNDHLAAAAANTDQAYPGIDHHRLLVLRPDYLLVVDLLASSDGKSHTFDWMVHNRGTAMTSAQATVEGPAPKGQGFEFIESTRRGQTDGPIRAEVTQALGCTYVLVNGEAGTELLVGTGVGESVLDRVPLLFITRQGASARFAAVLEPVASNTFPTVAEVRVDSEDAPGLAIVVRRESGREDRYFYDPEGGARTVSGIETSAKLLALSCEPGGEPERLGESL